VEFQWCFSSSEWMESENQLNEGVIRYINRVFAVLRRLYSKPTPPAPSSLRLKPSVKPSAGDQHAKSTGDRNLLTQGSQQHTAWTQKGWHTNQVNTRAGMFNTEQLGMGEVFKFCTVFLNPHKRVWLSGLNVSFRNYMCKQYWHDC